MKKALLPVVFAIFAIALIVYFSIPVKNNLTSSQKEALLEKTVGRDVSFSEDKVGENKKYEGKKVSFLYPGNAIVYEYKDSSFASTSGRIETFSYDIKDPRTVFNYNSIDRKATSLSDEPAVSLRRMKDRGYSEESLKLGDEAVKFTQTGSQANEVDIFILKDGVVYSFTASGSNLSLLNYILMLVSTTLMFK